MQPHIENEDVTWSPQYNMLVTRTNKRRGLPLQEVELARWLIHNSSHCTGNMYHPYDSCTRLIKSFVFHFYILGPTSRIWTNPSTEELKFESPSIYEDSNLEHWSATPVVVTWKVMSQHLFLNIIPNNDRGEPAVSYKWTGWVWEITGWSSRLQENYRSF